MKQDISSHLMAFREYFRKCFETSSAKKGFPINFDQHTLNNDVNERSHDFIRNIFTRESDARKTFPDRDRGQW